MTLSWPLFSLNPPARYGWRPGPFALLAEPESMTSNSSAQTLFLTGATGFLGHFVLRDLLRAGQRVIALLRPPLAESRHRLLSLLEQIGMEADKYLADGGLVLVEGALPGGLPEPSWGHTDAVLHCAASLQLFCNGNDEPFATNLAGTRAIIDWAERHGVRSIHSVSTAYTCGWNNGLILEQFHHPQPEFQTDYERSKWTAESQLAEWSRLPGRILTLYRPSFLIGDSSTGYTTQYAGFYQFAWVLSMLKERFHDPNNGERTYIPLRVPGHPDDRQNLVPVDFAARMVAEVVTRPQFHGRIYHLTNPEPPTNDFLKRCYEAYFGLCGGYFADPRDVVGQYSPAESILWDGCQVITPRIHHTPTFDVTHTRQVMQKVGLTFPTLSEQRLFRIFDYAAAQDWGRGAAASAGGRNGRHAQV